MPERCRIQVVDSANPPRQVVLQRFVAVPRDLDACVRAGEMSRAEAWVRRWVARGLQWVVNTCWRLQRALIAEDRWVPADAVPADAIPGGETQLRMAVRSPGAPSFTLSFAELENGHE